MANIGERLRGFLGLTPSGPHYFFYRHKWPVRIAHWVNALCLLVLLMSGLNIFNAHPALYIGNDSNFAHPILAMNAALDDDGYPVKGMTWLFGRSYDTTGWLGLSVEDGNKVVRGFPDWVTLPSPNWLAMARQWHFAFAWLLVINGVIFFLYGLLSRHFTRDLAPTAHDLKHLPQEIVDHAQLKFAHDERAKHYNALQKLAYCFVLFVLAPLILLTGLTMSPTMDSAFPILPAIFGGRQTARTIHFLCAFAFLGFFIIHIAMVVLSGTWNNLRSMLTGWYVIRKGESHG
jgi:thiosulfate reductase cytochrome b subunit